MQAILQQPTNHNHKIDKFINLVEEANQNRFFENIDWSRTLHAIAQEVFNLGYNKAWDFVWDMVDFNAIIYDGKQIKVNEDLLQKAIWMKLKS